MTNVRLGSGDEELRPLLAGWLIGDERAGGRATGGGGVAAVARAAINISNSGSTSGGQGGGSGGSGGGGGLGGGGIGGCVAASAWLCPDLLAGDATAGAGIDALIAGDPLTSERIAIDSVRFVFEPGVRLISASGVALACSNTTPIEQPDGSVIYAPHMAKAKGSAVVEDENGMRWEPIAAVTVLRHKIKVARIHVGGRTYAAGDDPTRRIYTHNPIK